MALLVLFTSLPIYSATEPRDVRDDSPACLSIQPDLRVLPQGVDSINDKDLFGVPIVFPRPQLRTNGPLVTSINGIGQTSPSVSCNATPAKLWSPDGKMTLIVISGRVTAGTQPLAPNGTKYAVINRYGQEQPSGSVTLETDGSYSVQIPLLSPLGENDSDSRTYIITIWARDCVGNIGSCSAIVKVPHDQGN